MDKNQNDVSTQSTAPGSKAPERTPLGVWFMAGIFGVGLIVLIVMSNIDF